MRVAFVVLGLAACSYSTPQAMPGDDTPPPPTPDAPTDDPPLLCTPDAQTCSGRTLKTCNATGDAFLADVTCPLSCETDHCTQASNIAAAMQTACTDTAPPFAPDGTSINIAIGGSAHALSCSNCNTITPQRIELGTTDLLVYCVSGFSLPNGRTLSVERGLDAAIAIFVAGNAQIDGTIDLRGDTDGNGVGSVTPPGGAGGFAGGTTAAATQAPGSPGSGSCGGGGGATTTQTNNVGGGGGGGGYVSAAGAGGTGHQADNTPSTAGSAGALCVVSPATLEPLIGGSGGGAGGDGACNTTSCGRPGGGGGGAIQVSATGTLAIGGSILAGGGDGGFIASSANDRGGGGGGGAGGAILLEAPALTLTGTLDVRGGKGGDSDNTLGGAGGTPFVAPGTGTDGGADLGGGGGGGALGRIRLNGTTGATCPAAMVTDPCTSSTLKLVPATTKPAH